MRQRRAALDGLRFRRRCDLRRTHRHPCRSVGRHLVPGAWRPVLADFERLTSAIIMEALRLYPPAWLGPSAGQRPHTGWTAIRSALAKRRSSAAMSCTETRVGIPTPTGSPPSAGWTATEGLPRCAYVPFVRRGAALLPGRHLAFVGLMLTTAAMGRRARLRLPDVVRVRPDARRTLIPTERG